MKFSWPHRLAAAALGIGGAGLLIFALWTAGTAFRVSRAFESSCDNVPQTAPTGMWVRLRNCAADVNLYAALVKDGKVVVRDLKRVWRNPERRRPVPPSQALLAIPLPPPRAPLVFRSVHETDSLPEDVVPLPETVGVIMGRVGVQPYVVSVRPVDSLRVAYGAVILDVSPPPTFQYAGMLAALGFLLLGSARWVQTRGIPAVVMRLRLPPVSRYSPRYQPRPAGHISWGWMLLPVLLIVLLFRGMQVYVDSPRNAAPAAAAAAAAAPPLPPARQASLDQLLARVPRDRHAFEGNLSPELSDTLDALIEHGNESPDRVRDALIPAAYSSNEMTRHKALTGFRSIAAKLPPIPQPLIEDASFKGVFQQRAFEAALALGARRSNPQLLINGAHSFEMKLLVQQELRDNPDEASARILARIWVDGADAEFARLAYAREKSSHDISAALVEIVLDSKQPEPRRTQAAYRLGTLDEVGALTPLRTFAVTLAPGVLKQSVDDTIDKLDTLQRRGRAPQMRDLH